MKSNKKLIIILTALSLLTPCAFAAKDNSTNTEVEWNNGVQKEVDLTITEGSGKCGDSMTWVLDENGTLTISGTGEMDEYIYKTSQTSFTDEEREQYIAEIEKHKFPWFESNDAMAITSVIVESGVESISDMAFYGTSIASITLPNSVKKIGESSIANCAKLKELILSDNITSIPLGAFNWDYSLTTVQLPSNLKSIGTNAFLNCEALENIFIPSSVTEIDRAAFSRCGLCELILPEGVTTINSSICSANPNLTKLVLPPKVNVVEESAFVNCANLEEIILPDSLTKIGDNAFSYINSDRNSDLPKQIVYVPESVKTIDRNGIDSGSVIYGFKNSVAEKYATENEIEFVEITESMYDAKEYSEAVKQQSQLMPTETTEPVKVMPKSLTVQGGEVPSIKIDGKEVKFSDVYPYVDENGRTQVPIYAILSELGLTLRSWQVEWNGPSTAIIEGQDDFVMKITIGNNVMIVNDKEITMDTAAVNIGDRTYIPLRFAAEALGLEVNWVE